MSLALAPEATLESRFIDELEQHLDGLPLSQLRREALDAFRQHGFPALREELWKYTPIRKRLDQNYRISGYETSQSVSRENLESLEIKGADPHLVVFVNGNHNASLSRIGSLPDGVVLSGLRDAFETHPELVASHFGKYAETDREPFVAVNTASDVDGVFLYVPENVELERPVHALFVSNTDEDVFFQTRSLYVFEKGCKASVAETRNKLGQGRTFMNAVTEAYVGEDAWVRMYNVQDEGTGGSLVNTLQSVQDGTSHYAYSSFVLSGELVRNNLNYLPNANGCETHLNGLVIAGDQSHVDNHTYVDHAMPECESNELFKHVLRDKATAVFNGKIHVRQDAQLTNAYQSNKSVLLSDDARIYAKPELEIYADDVKCSHGATFGRLDEEAMFYLRSRGLSEDSAKRMLLRAFVSDVVATVTLDELRNQLDEKIGQLLS